MLLSYELTQADFREAQISHSHSSTARRPRRGLLYIASFVMFYLLLSFVMPILINGASVSGPSQQRSNLLWIHFLLPFLVVGLMLMIISIVSLFRSHGRRKRAVVTLLGSFAIMASFAFMMILQNSAATLASPGLPQPSTPLDWPAILYPHLGWFALMLFLTFFIIRSQIAAVSRAWKKQSHLHMPQTADITAAGVIITSASARHDYRWTAFPRHLETPNLFLLYLSDVSFQILPKRAFATEEELTGFRHMAKNLIGKTSSGFEVLTPAP